MEVGDKDIYEYISNFADDKTVIDMILANPKVFDKESFYEKVMRKRYPLLIEFWYNNETWKTLYLRMVYTLAKLQEDYQVPYIPTKGCNPEKILASATSGEVYNQALSCAAAGGNIPLIDYFLKKGASNIETALGTAGRYSNLNTVKYLISKGAKGYGHLLEFAAFGGNIDTMNFAFDVLRLEGFNINEFHGRSALQNAISAGHIEAVKFLIDNGIEIIPYNIQYAVSKNQYDIAEYLKQFI